MLLFFSSSLDSFVSFSIFNYARLFGCIIFFLWICMRQSTQVLSVWKRRRCVSSILQICNTKYNAIFHFIFTLFFSLKELRDKNFSDTFYFYSFHSLFFKKHWSCFPFLYLFSLGNIFWCICISCWILSVFFLIFYFSRFLILEILLFRFLYSILNTYSTVKKKTNEFREVKNLKVFLHGIFL